MDDPRPTEGRQLGPYRLERQIGEGLFATVYAAADAEERPMALKVLKPKYACDPRFREYFQAECMTAASLDHPNIVRIADVGCEDDRLYFAMDLHPDTLTNRIRREGRIPEAECVRLMRGVARALAFAHDHHVIHRDIKTDNVLLARDGRPVLTDFGLAKALNAYVSEAGANMTIGTPQYLSPEQAQGRPLDARVDLYALGITFYKAATGQVPFSSPDWFELARQHVEDPPVPMRRHEPTVSRRFERIVLKCLAKHPDDRYPDARALLQELDDIEHRLRRTESVGAAPMSMSTMRQALTEPWRLRWDYVVAAGIALAVAVLVVWVLRA